MKNVHLQIDGAILNKLGIQLSDTPLLIKKGMSGSEIWLLSNCSQKLILKIGDEDKIKDEVNHYLRILPLLDGTLAKLHGHGSKFLCREYVDKESWFEKIAKDAPLDMSVVKKVSEALVELWVGSAVVPDKPTYHYITKVNRDTLPVYLELTFGQQLDSSTRVNGETSVTMNEVVGIINVLFSTPLQIKTLTHGDPRGENIIDDRLIDPRPNYFDWVYDLALLSRWQSCLSLSSLEAQQKISDTISVDYGLSNVNEEIDEYFAQIGQRVAEKLNDNNWRWRWYAYMGCSSFGERRLLNDRASLNLVDNKINFNAFLLGQGLQYFTKSKKYLNI